jgi:hypothetical protein
MRNSAADKSEQVSQLLFGEVVEVIDRAGRAWTKVRCPWDNCLGWVKSRQLLSISMETAQHFQQRFAYCLDVFQPLLSNEHAVPVTLGARLPDFDGMKFSLDDQTYFYSGRAVFPEHLTPTADQVAKIARRYLFSPYQWGGRSPLGIDASGFTQMVFRIVGIPLQRLPDKQVHQGVLVDFIDEAEPGDLAFFENKAGNISHTGILLPDNRIIHAYEQVRIDRLDHYGIYVEKERRYSHRLRVVKRLLPKAAHEAARADGKPFIREEEWQGRLF